MIWPPGINSEFTELYLLNLIPLFDRHGRARRVPGTGKEEIAIARFTF
jgi:hypothetical protein